MKRRDDHGDGDEHDPPGGRQDRDNGPGSAGKSGQNHAGEAAAGEVVPPAFDGLSRRQGQAIEALLKEPTIARAALASGVYERTLRRWMKKPRFRAVWLAARREAFGQAIGLCQRYTPAAAATLVKIMNDPGAPAAVRVTAAALVMKFGREGVEIDDLQERVADLERNAWGGHGPVVDEPKENEP